MLMNEVFAAIDRLKPGERFPYQALAKKYGCCRTTLSRRHKRQTVSHEQKSENQRILHPHNKAELVQYIRELTKRYLPTRQTIVRFATPLLPWEPSNRWVSRLLHQHPNTLITHWSAPVEQVRHQADSHEKYSRYFTFLHRKIDEKDIEPGNTYDMDEKGFMIGAPGRTVRMFDKLITNQGGSKQSSHDGNRTWMTLLACICADGTALPPG